MQNLVTLGARYIYISTILQNKEKQFNLINKIRVGAMMLR